MKDNEQNTYEAGQIYKCYRWTNDNGIINVHDSVGYMKIIAVVGELIFVSKKYQDVTPLLEGEYIPDGGNYNKYEFCNSNETYKHVLYTPSAKFIEAIKAFIS